MVISKIILKKLFLKYPKFLALGHFKIILKKNPKLFVIFSSWAFENYLKHTFAKIILYSQLWCISKIILKILFLKYLKFSALGLSPDVAGATFMAAGATQIVKIKLLMKSKS